MFGLVERPQAWLTAAGMARLAGAPLVRAVLEGWLTRSDLSRLTARCDACGSGASCRAWQAAGRAGVPAFCPIKPEIDALVPFR